MIMNEINNLELILDKNKGEQRLFCEYGFSRTKENKDFYVNADFRMFVEYSHSWYQRVYLK